MENAGRAAALVLHRLWPQGRIVGIAGSGNNGGDLIVMARTLRAWGRDVHVVMAGSSPPDSALLHGAALELHDADDDATSALLTSAAVLVDGMLGTGATGVPRGRIAAMIERIGTIDRPVLALDLPSGVDADTGQVAPASVNAAATVCFGWPKLGLMLHPARARCGRLIAVEIGFPASSIDVAAFAITPDRVTQRLRARAADAHKGSVGRLLVLAGSPGMAGAAAHAAEAASRAGAGHVRIITDESNRTILQTLVPEATFVDTSHIREAQLEPMNALVAGPGLGQDDAAHDALQRVLDGTPSRPTLLDADALNIFATRTDDLTALAAARPLVITPHAGELSRLTTQSVDVIRSNAPAAARAAAERFGCVVLLKGQPTVIASPDGTLLVTTVGSSDLASAGMGDQLAGVIGALLAGGMTPLDAASTGVYLSGRAADLAALGRSLTPRDVSLHLADAFADVGPSASPLGLPFITFDQPPRH
jgi:NAD(P)H-hydrate epimerase